MPAQNEQRKVLHTCCTVSIASCCLEHSSSSLLNAGRGGTNLLCMADINQERHDTRYLACMRSSLADIATYARLMSLSYVLSIHTMLAKLHSTCIRDQGIALYRLRAA